MEASTNVTWHFHSCVILTRVTIQSVCVTLMNSNLWPITYILARLITRYLYRQNVAWGVTLPSSTSASRHIAFLRWGDVHTCLVGLEEDVILSLHTWPLLALSAVDKGSRYIRHSDILLLGRHISSTWPWLQQILPKTVIFCRKLFYFLFKGNLRGMR